MISRLRIEREFLLASDLRGDLPPVPRPFPLAFFSTELAVSGDLSSNFTFPEVLGLGRRQLCKSAPDADTDPELRVDPDPPGTYFLLALA